MENIRRTKCNFCKIPCLEAISLPSLRKFSEDLRVAASVKEKRSFPNFASNIKLIQDGGRYHIETSPLICSSEKLIIINVRNLLNPLQPGIAYLYPLKTSENL